MAKFAWAKEALHFWSVSTCVDGQKIHQNHLCVFFLKPLADYRISSISSQGWWVVWFTNLPIGISSAIAKGIQHFHLLAFLGLGAASNWGKISIRHLHTVTQIHHGSLHVSVKQKQLDSRNFCTWKNESHFQVEFHFRGCEHESISSCTPKPHERRRIHGVALVALYLRWKGRGRGAFGKSGDGEKCEGMLEGIWQFEIKV